MSNSPANNKGGGPGHLGLVWMALVLAICAAYSNSLHVPFLFDDTTAIAENPAIRSLSELGPILWPPPETSVSGRPVFSLSLALNYAISGSKSIGFHVGNILIHCLAAGAMFGFVRRTLMLPALHEKWSAAATVTSGSFALLWALHPIATECVTYLTQRAEALTGLFCLVTLWAFAKAAQSSKRFRPLWLTLSAISSLMAMLSKEAAAGLPLIVACYDWVFIQRSASLKKSRWRWGYYLALALGWIALGAIIANAPRSLSVGFGFEGMGMWEYFTIQCQAIPYYVAQVFWPSRLIFDYAWPVPRSNMEWVPHALILTTVFGASLVALFKRRAAGFLGMTFFLLLGPTSSLVPIVTDPVSEHRLYLAMACPLAGLFFGGLAGVRWMANLRGGHWLTAATHGWCAIAVLVAVFLGCLTHSRNRDYRSAYALWMDTSRKMPGNARAWLNAGSSVWEEQRDPEMSIRLMRKAVELAPKDTKTIFSLGSLLVRAGNFAEAESWLLTAARQNAGWPDVWVNLGYCYLCQEKRDQARASFEQALNLKPNHAGAHFFIAKIAEYDGNKEAELQHLRKCLDADPLMTEARERLNALTNQY